MASISSELENFLTKDVYDRAIKCGTLAKNERINNKERKMNKNTVNNIVELFFELSQNNSIDALMLLMVYIKRQERREEVGRETSNTLISDLKYIFDKFKGKPEYLDQAVRKYLLLFKWSFESEVERSNNFDDFLNKIIRQR